MSRTVPYERAAVNRAVEQSQIRKAEERVMATQLRRVQQIVPLRGEEEYLEMLVDLARGQNAAGQPSYQFLDVMLALMTWRASTFCQQARQLERQRDNALATMEERCQVLVGSIAMLGVGKERDARLAVGVMIAENRLSELLGAIRALQGEKEPTETEQSCKAI